MASGIATATAKGILEAPPHSSKPPPAASSRPPHDPPNLPPDSTIPSLKPQKPDFSKFPPKSSKPPSETPKSPQRSPSPSPTFNSLPIPTALPTLTIPLPGSSTLTLDAPSAVATVHPVPPAVSTILSNAPPLVSTVLSHATSAISTILSVGKSGTSKALSDIPPAVSTILSDTPPLISSVLSDASSAISTALSIATSGASKALSALPPAVSTILSDAPPLVSTVVSNATSAISTALSIATSEASKALSDASSVLSGIPTSFPVTPSNVTAGSSLISQATQSLQSILSAGGSSLGSIVSNVTHTILSSPSVSLNVTPFPYLPPNRSPTTSTELPTLDSSAPTATLPLKNPTPTVSLPVSPSIPLVRPSLSQSALTVSSSQPVDSPSILPLNQLSTPSTPTVLSNGSAAPSLTTVSSLQPLVSSSRVLVNGTIGFSPTTHALSAHLNGTSMSNATSTSISGHSSLRQPMTTGPHGPVGSQGSGSHSPGIPSVTQDSASPTPTPGFFHQPAMVVGTFTAVGVVVVTAAAGIIVLTHLRGRRRRGAHRIPNNDPDEEGRQNNGPVRQRSLRIDTHRSVVSRQGALPSSEDMQAETRLFSARNPPDSNYQALGMSESLAARNSWTILLNSQAPTSPVDPVDPHGWPIITSETERNIPNQRRDASPEPYSADPGTRAAVGWMLADGASSEFIPDDDDDSESLLNSGHGTRSTRQ